MPHATAYYHSANIGLFNTTTIPFSGKDIDKVVDKFVGVLTRCVFYSATITNPAGFLL